MAQTIGISLSLGSSQTGLTLKAQLTDDTGANTGGEITTGFTEIGMGNYYFVNDFADDFQGGCKVLTNADVLMGFCEINPVQLSPSGLANIQVEEDLDARQALSLCTAVLAGELAIVDDEVTISAAGSSDTRVVATTDEDGNRSDIELTPSS